MQQKPHMEDLLAPLLTEKKDLEAQLAEKTKQLESLISAINALQGISIRQSWQPKILEYIKTQGKLIKTIDILGQQEQIISPAKRKNYITAISISLTTLVEKGILCKVQIPGEKGYSYGLPEWFVDGEPWEEFRREPTKKF